MVNKYSNNTRMDFAVVWINHGYFHAVSLTRREEKWNLFNINVIKVNTSDIRGGFYDLHVAINDINLSYLVYLSTLKWRLNHAPQKNIYFEKCLGKKRFYCPSHESSMIGFIKIFQRAVKRESRSMPSTWLQDEQVGVRYLVDVTVVLLNSSAVNL